MTPINSKRKGSDFERYIAKKLTNLLKGGEFKRIAGSGAIGTNMGIPTLTGDLRGEVIGFPRSFKGESKIGYGGSKSMTLKKEWLDKIIEEAKTNYAIPFLIGRFSGSRSGVEEFVILDLDTFAMILNSITDLYLELENVTMENDQ